VVAVLPKQGVDAALLPVRPTAGQVVPALVGAEKLPKLELPLVLEDGEPDNVRWRPLGQIALRWWKCLPAALDVFIERQPFR
jgi:hypothetical protein